MTVYRGSCHCGAVRFEFDAEISALIKCDCSLCRKKNALMASAQVNQFRLTAGQDKLGLYQWNTGAARHHFCTVCGIYTHHQRRTMPDTYGVNVFCIEDVDPAAIAVIETHGSTLSVAE